MPQSPQPPSPDRKTLSPTSAETPRRVLVIGAHPDDCEIRAGGTAVLWREQGWVVDFLSMTDGAAGHQTMSGPVLADRRRREAEEAAAQIGATAYTLNLPDGGVEPTVAQRRQLVRFIRQRKPDLILTHRPGDYHPDHRYTAQLVQDASFQLVVPGIEPDVPPMLKCPPIFHVYDGFTDPRPFEADVVVAIDRVMSRKVDMLVHHESQFFEWLPWLGGEAAPGPEDVDARRALVKRWLENRHKPTVAEACQVALESRYGAQGRSVRYAEAFAQCPYGGSGPASTRPEDLFPR